MDRYLIWSIEHDAWWRPASWGYTRDITQAGIFSTAEANRIIARANTVAVQECMIPIDCILLDSSVHRPHIGA